MGKTYTRRGLPCPTCGAALRVRLTGYKSGTVIRYRYCGGCARTFKTAERFLEDFIPGRRRAQATVRITNEPKERPDV